MQTTLKVKSINTPILVSILTIFLFSGCTSIVTAPIDVASSVIGAGIDMVGSVGGAVVNVVTGGGD
jgi:hypothetical protein